MPTAQNPRLPRLVFVDVLRLIAAVQMIVGHAVSAVLAPAYQSGLVFAVWSFVRGLTSVIFLFTAGLSFALAEAHGRVGKRVRRALLLIALGYLLHAPFALLLGAPREPTLQAALAVDVLQCIGVSLLSLELVRWLCPKAREAFGLTFTVGMVFLMQASRVFTAPVQGPLRPLANYVSPQGGSLFPLVPWLGYVMMGCACGIMVRRSPAGAPAWLRSSAGVALAVGGGWFVSLRDLPLAANSGYCLIKLGCVLALAAAMAAQFRTRSLPPLLSRLSRETLFLYVSHVVILYADEVGLARQIGSTRSPWFGLCLAIALLVTCSAGALAWRSLRSPRTSGTRAPQT